MNTSIVTTSILALSLLGSGQVFASGDDFGRFGGRSFGSSDVRSMGGFGRGGSISSVANGSLSLRDFDERRIVTSVPSATVGGSTQSVSRSDDFYRPVPTTSSVAGVPNSTYYGDNDYARPVAVPSVTGVAIVPSSGYYYDRD
jgi:hypothetical protein